MYQVTQCGKIETAENHFYFALLSVLYKVNYCTKFNHSSNTQQIKSYNKANFLSSFFVVFAQTVWAHSVVLLVYSIDNTTHMQSNTYEKLG